MRHKEKQVGITFLQILTALSFGGFIYCQTKLISGLEQNALNRNVLALTMFFLLTYILFELLENYVREKLFAGVSASTKQKAARAFLFRCVQAHAAKSEEQHISYFSNEIGAVLEQNLYLRLYLRKQFVMFFFSLLTLFVIARECSFVVIFSAVVFGAVIHWLSNKLKDKQCLLQNKKTAFVENLMELHRGFEEIHINQMEAMAGQEFAQANVAVEQAQYNYRISLGRLEVLGVGQNMMLYILILTVGGMLACKGLVGVGIFVSAAELSVQALNEWSVITQMYAMVRGSQQLKKEMDVYVEEPEVPARQICPKDGELLVDVRGLCFGYEEATPLLKDVNLSISKGKKYLITGESGCGKSTFLELLMGHKNGADGEIRYYTDKIAYLPQTPFLFPGTLRENLIFGGKAEDDALKELLAKVGLSLSLDMMIAEDGGNLSGGQKARIALARALMAQPDLLVADEVTANLDGETGQQMEELLLDGYPEMALCMVAHRVYFPKRYDVTVEMDKHAGCEVTV